MSYDKLVCNLIFKWWSRPSALFNRTNIIHMTTSVRMIKYNMFVCLMVFNATFNNISFISWWSVLLVEETRVPGENHWPVATEDPEKTTDLLQVSDKLYHIMLYTSPWSRFEHTTSVVIGTDCIGSCTSYVWGDCTTALFSRLCVRWLYNNAVLQVMCEVIV